MKIIGYMWRWVLWKGEWRAFIDVVFDDKTVKTIHIGFPVHLANDLAKLLSGQIIPKLTNRYEAKKLKQPFVPRCYWSGV